MWFDRDSIRIFVGEELFCFSVLSLCSLEKVATLSETMIETSARLKDLAREDGALQREVELAQKRADEREQEHVALLHSKEERDVTLNTLQEALLASQVRHRRLR